MSSFQGVGIEEFHCIQRCSHFGTRAPLYTEVLLFWNRGFSLYTEVSLFQGGVGWGGGIGGYSVVISVCVVLVNASLISRKCSLWNI